MIFGWRRDAKKWREQEAKKKAEERLELQEKASEVWEAWATVKLNDGFVVQRKLESCGYYSSFFNELVGTGSDYIKEQHEADLKRENGYKVESTFHPWHTIKSIELSEPKLKETKEQGDDEST